MIIELVLGVAIAYSILFVLSIILKDNSIVDIYWGIGFSIIAIHTMILMGNYSIPHIIFLLIIILWSTRISSYILYKRIKRGGEDARYVNFRKSWKFFYTRSILQVYLLQGLLMLIISTAIILFMSSQNYILNYFFYVGTIIALFGLIYETVGDLQLSKFISNKNNKGKIMKSGLWKYSRHPNYFGESVFWLGITIIAIPISYYALISFLTITILLRFVSGVPMAEKNYEGNKEYEKYKKNTPPMIPKLRKLLG